MTKEEILRLSEEEKISLLYDVSYTYSVEESQLFDTLITDPNPYIRKEVAYRGRDKDLDKLVHDPDRCVRRAVAYRGRDKDLDKLVHDPDADVRYEVLQWGRRKDLEILKGDKVTHIREGAQKSICNLNAKR